tara:strand:- start:3047 stop:3319 length:273 start_codon:yes stop_codon:yes gene_type:complete
MTDERSLEEKQADERYYEVLLSLFLTDGWKQLKEEFTKNFLDLNKVTNVKVEHVDYVKGQLNILHNLINLEESTRFAIDQMNAGDDNEIN